MKKSDHDDIEKTAKVNAFGDLIYAAMLSAAVERKLTQFKTELTPVETGKRAVIRIIVVPETMDVEQPGGFKSY